MREGRRWRWPWIGRGAIVVAILAALALAGTLLMAKRALDNACGVVTRGDADVLVSDVILDLWETEPELTPQTFAAVIARHADRGLRYVALVDRQDQHQLMGAGTPTIAGVPFMLGEIAREGPRARLVSVIPARSMSRAALDPGAAPTGPSQLQSFPRPYVAIEFEPPLIGRLKAGIARSALVALVAAVALITFALALSRSNARLWRAQQQAESERRLVELGRASAVIAHELRNPLAALKGHAQLLAEDLAEPSRTKAARVVEGAERLEGLTNVLLDFVRDAPIDVRAVNPADVVDRALAPLPKERVRVDLSAAPATLQVDAERTSLALRNLVHNAVQATPDGGAPVEVRIAGDARESVIEVRDHGPGLAPGAEAQIFEPFVTTKTRGTGLGLSIARRIAEQHSGTLTGETHRQGGAVFRLVLPLVSKPGGPA